MIPLYAVGLAIAGKMLLSKTGTLDKIRSARTARYQTMFRPITAKVTLPPVNINPLSGIIKAFSSIAQKFSQGLTSENTKKEDYDTIVKAFLPEGASILVPHFPVGSNSVHTVDIDGDSQNELVVAYLFENETNIVVYKKNNSIWSKLTEYKNYDYNNINYIGFADITGSNSKNILIGWETQETYNNLEFLSLQDGKLKSIASREYNRLEVMDFTQKNQPARCAEVAVWTKDINETHSIEVLKWNGSDLEALNDISDYYQKSVVPYYLQRARQIPSQALHWYCLTDACIKSGSYRDGIIAADMGLRYCTDQSMEERLYTLRNTALEKLR